VTVSGDNRPRLHSAGGALVLLGVLLVLLGVTGCSGAGIEKGGCALPEGEDYRSADCAEPGALRVLEVRGSADFCRDVPAVTVVHQSWGDDRRYCMGPPDADPATAVNVAQVGDCVHVDADGQSYVRVDCANPAAQLQVLHRIEGYAVALNNECSAVAGTSVEYEWKVVGNGLALLSMDNIFFCFGPAGVDPRTFIENAQPGDCVKETGAQPEWAIVDCGAPDAAFRVHGREDGFAAAISPCEEAPEATTSLQGSRRGSLEGPFTLCLGPL
jgi:hypothetical protein